MTNQLSKIIPSAELLTEMEELEILGGLDSEGGNVHVYAVVNCHVVINTGNCVSGCACTPPPSDPGKDDGPETGSGEKEEP